MSNAAWLCGESSACLEALRVVARPRIVLAAPTACYVGSVQRLLFDCDDQGSQPPAGRDRRPRLSSSWALRSWNQNRLILLTTSYQHLGAHGHPRSDASSPKPQWHSSVKSVTEKIPRFSTQSAPHITLAGQDFSWSTVPLQFQSKVPHASANWK